MSARVYVLLDVAQGERDEVVRTLRDRPGVTMADIVEGPPDIVMVVEAPQRLRLAELTIQALGSIEGMTENLQLLPVTANKGKHQRGKSNTYDRQARRLCKEEEKTSETPIQKDRDKVEDE